MPCHSILRKPLTDLDANRKTLVIDGENDDPLLSLLDHLLSLAAHDNAFEAKSAQHVENIFRARMPPGRKSLILKWKRDVLDLPVFREKFADKTLRCEHVDWLSEATLGEGGFSTLLHPIWTLSWPLECRQQYVCFFLIYGPKKLRLLFHR